MPPHAAPLDRHDDRVRGVGLTHARTRSLHAGPGPLLGNRTLQSWIRRRVEVGDFAAAFPVCLQVKLPHSGISLFEGKADLCHQKNRVYPYPISDTSRHKSKLLVRVRRLKGQIETIEPDLKAGAPCGDVLNLVASIRGAVTGLTAELIEDHIREHVCNPETDENANRSKGTAELIEVIRTYMK